MFFLNSQALQDLGIFAAVSVLGASCFAFLFIPLVYKDSPKTIKKNTVIDKIASYNLHKNKWAIIIITALFIGSFFCCIISAYLLLIKSREFISFSDTP